MQGAVDLSFWRLGAAFIFVIILLIIFEAKGINKRRELIIATIRMTLQLVLVGYILVSVFETTSPYITILIVLCMEVFAIFNIFKRVKYSLSKPIKKVIALSMVFGTLLSLIYFMFVVINISPWFDPRYFIPISGMIIGNSMTGISLGVTNLVSGIKNQKYKIESSLMLGATPKVATKHIVDAAFDSAILPTMNSMLGMGIVFLPGMMTGQILSGTSPLTAIEYQIAIMLGILGSVSLTVVLFVHLGYKTFFNEESQLVL